MMAMMVVEICCEKRSFDSYLDHDYHYYHRCFCLVDTDEWGNTSTASYYLTYFLCEQIHHDHTDDPSRNAYTACIQMCLPIHRLDGSRQTRLHRDNAALSRTRMNPSIAPGRRRARFLAYRQSCRTRSCAGIAPPSLVCWGSSC